MHPKHFLVRSPESLSTTLTSSLWDLETEWAKWSLKENYCMCK